MRKRACAVLIIAAVLTVAVFAAAGDDATPPREGAAASYGSPECDVSGSIAVEYTGDHPYRVGIGWVDENCRWRVRYEDLTPEEFAELGAEAGGGAEERLVPVPQGPAASN